MQLKEKILKRINEDKALQGLIAAESNVGFVTIERWIDANSDRLLNLKVLEIIKTHIGAKDIKELVENN